VFICGSIDFDMSATLYVAISSHGYGHIAQTAPVVNELYRRMRDLRVVVECAASRDVLAKRFDMAFDHVPVSSDFGMVMKNALEVDVAASHARYADAHARLDAAIEESRKCLMEHGADLLLANVPYVPLIAAKRLGLPAIAMCSLNWADIYHALCTGMPGADRIQQDMVCGYEAANVFIALKPGMDMPELRDVRKIGPVAATGKSVRSALNAKLGLSDGERLVAVSMGGIATELATNEWPRIAGVTWVMPDSTTGHRDDMVTHSALEAPFIDILSSSDALVTKPGYGAFTEAACNGVPVLYVPRVDWPEAPFLVRWLERHGRCSAISYDDLFSEHLGEALKALWQLPHPQAVAPTGITEAADIVHSLLVK
jgi:UDP:flavonoid glycosyltransferase YjiC (YdhE family)